MTICAEFDGRSWKSCTRGPDCICGFDSPQRVALILEKHNRWRRGEDGAEQLHPEAIGAAIDAAVIFIRSATASASHPSKSKGENE